ncbi:hypothetical protein [Heliophilum fasciatum]|uniref:S-layer protein SbsC C-terminal domain-containing protein n=1 Tax=Heliophilum fasciatum TaxID=35700 RepID=A0A4V2SWS9_9FIRM|nr:hypothetical protein [Heliophilum fasciatum]MCW2278445.1 hypothetical protein [Heliophilum fasciatum]TCP63576.1 hypothetical protein EDD73_1171 [Heliophilum fasciatum]
MGRRVVRKSIAVLLTLWMLFGLVLNVSLPLPGGGAALAASGGTWDKVGGDASPTASATAAYYDNGTYYLAYMDISNATKILRPKVVVKKLNTGTTPPTWDPVGTGNIGVDGVGVNSLSMSLYVDNGTPYVAYLEKDVTSGLSALTNFDGKLTVMKLNNSNTWSAVGSTKFSGKNPTSIKLVVINNVPYVAYKEGSSILVKRYINNAWSQVGSTKSTNSTWGNVSLDVYDGTPFIAFPDSDNGDKASLLEFNGTDWESWESAGTSISSGTAKLVSLYIDNGVPYLAFQDENQFSRITVKKYNSITKIWESVGRDGFSNPVGATFSIGGLTLPNISVTVGLPLSLYVDNGIPYVAYQDGTQSAKASVMKYTGTDWVPVGGLGFSSTPALYPTLRVTNGTTNLALWNGGKVALLQYTPTPAPELGATAAEGTAANSTKVTATVTDNSGNHLVIKKSSSTITTPNVGDTAPSGNDVIDPYTAEANISGIDDTTNKYLGVTKSTPATPSSNSR